MADQFLYQTCAIKTITDNAEGLAVDDLFFQSTLLDQIRVVVPGDGYAYLDIHMLGHEPSSDINTELDTLVSKGWELLTPTETDESPAGDIVTIDPEDNVSSIDNESAYLTRTGYWTIDGLTLVTSIDEISTDITLGDDSDTAVPTEHAVKTYVDTLVTAQDLDFDGDAGTGAVDLDSQVFSIVGTANRVSTSAAAQILTITLPQDIHIGASPTFAGLTLSGLVAGATDSVIIEDAGVIKKRAIDTRVWGTSLADATNGVNNRVVTFLDANSLNGEQYLTFNGATLAITGALTVSTTITCANIGADTSNDVVVLNAGGLLKTDVIDPKVWAGALVDGSGTLNYHAKWTPDGNTLGDSLLYDDATNVGLGIYTGLAGLFHTAKSNADNGTYLDTYDDGASYSRIYIRKSDTDTIGNVAQTDSADVLGLIEFQGVNNTAPGFRPGAQITVTQNGVANTYVPTDLKIETWTSTGQNVNQFFLQNDGKVGIGTAPSYLLHVNGTVGLESTIYAPNIGADTSNDVVILTAAGLLKTDEIDARVWGTSLVDGSGTLNFHAKWTPDTNSMGDSILYDDGDNASFVVGAVEAWDSAYLAVQYGGNNAILTARGESEFNQFTLMQNCYTNDMGSGLKRSVAAAASSYKQFGGTHQFYCDASDTADTFFTPTEIVRIDSTGLGIGIAAPDTLLHVWGASAGAVTAVVGALLTIESNGDTYMNFLSPNNAAQYIYFGDADDNDVAWFGYTHNGTAFAWGVETAAKMLLFPTSLQMSSGIDIFLPDSTYIGCGSTFGAEDIVIGSLSADTPSITIMNDFTGHTVATDGTKMHLLSGNFVIDNRDQGGSIWFQYAGATFAQFLPAGVIFGNDSADVDVSLTFAANTNSGLITWMEDEDYFLFADTINCESYILQQGIFGEIYCADASAAQSIATGTTYTKLTGFTANGQSANCTNDVANDKITITKTGRYLVGFSVNGTAGTANLTWRIAAFLNGTEQDQVHTKRNIKNSSEAGSMSGTGFIDVTTVPWDLDLRARHSGVSDADFVPEYMNLNCVYVGST